jgi:pimeloyl-ACP methyl ester carboxylesterase
MTVLAVRGAGALAGGAPLDRPANDSWRQDDETSGLSAAERAAEARKGPLVPDGTVPLVLLHAYPLSSSMWGPFAGFAADLPILTIDLPGAGMSPTLEVASIKEAGLAVAETLAELGVARAVLAGISMGGYVAMSVLKQTPQLVAGLALMHTKATADTPKARAGRLEVAREVLASSSVDALAPMAGQLVSAESAKADPDLVDRLRAWIAEATPEGVAWAQEAMAKREDSSRVLSAFGAPALVVAGELDPFSSVADAEAMVDGIGPSAQLDVFLGVAHLSPLECPDALSRVVRGFYRRIG